MPPAAARARRRTPAQRHFASRRPRPAPRRASGEATLARLTAGAGRGRGAEERAAGGARREGGFPQGVGGGDDDEEGGGGSEEQATKSRRRPHASVPRCARAAPRPSVVTRLLQLRHALEAPPAKVVVADPRAACAPRSASSR
ncbi:unnamed protein product [Prorocentrum cordatum]|uniref:Uncharacterized protein n=1 Tax=Prorocentrum cordatum TaxID=2364126 RepID=A0ABN9UEH4_9DINO|nr:unnamed protein product [Polarella glacialis]